MTPTHRHEAAIIMRKRRPASSEGAAEFRAACRRLGVGPENCRDVLGIGRTTYYDLGNGIHEVSETLWRLIDLMEDRDKLLSLVTRLEEQLERLKQQP